MRFVLTAVVGLYAGTTSAIAGAPCPTTQALYEWNKVTAQVDMTKVSELVSCIHGLRAEKEELEERVRNLDEANKTAWSAFEDPATLVEQVPRFKEIYTPPKMVVFMYDLKAAFKSISGVDDDQTMLDSLERRYMKAGALKDAYLSLKSVIIRLVESKLTSHMTLTLLEDLRPLIEKPFDPLLASQAVSWYRERCVSEQEAMAASPYAPLWPTQVKALEQCENKAFAEAFKAKYGKDPTLSTAYMLGSANRRYLRGGSGFIGEIQWVLADILKEIAPKSAVASVPAVEVTKAAPKKK